SVVSSVHLLLPRDPVEGALEHVVGARFGGKGAEGTLETAREGELLGAGRAPVGVRLEPARGPRREVAVEVGVELVGERAGVHDGSSSAGSDWRSVSRRRLRARWR